MELRTLLIQKGIDPEQLGNFIVKSVVFAKHLQNIRVPGDEIQWITQELDIVAAEKFQLEIDSVEKS